MKISIIGAGNVGATLAERILMSNLADVVLVDVASDLAKAKAFDLSDAGPIMKYKTRVIGTGNYKDTKDSHMAVITAGFPRQPGMSREDLIEKNLKVVRSVLGNIKTYAPNALILMVTNPLDIMTYMGYKESACERSKIMGMAGSLDTSRFKALLSEELGVGHEKIRTCVLGSHGDTMVPLVSKTSVNGKPLESVLDKQKIDGLVAKTKRRGGEIVSLLKSGSAFFSPSAACFEMINAVTNDTQEVIPCSCVLDGEYGIEHCAIGVPARIGKDGISEILTWELPDNELADLRNSARAIRDVLNKFTKEVKNARGKQA